MTVPITNITASIITNSRGNQTIRVTVQAEAYEGTFEVPEGASTGSKEVAVLAPEKALTVIETIVAPALKGVAVTNQAQVDKVLHELDGTIRFETIGGNVALGVSVGALKAASAVLGIGVWQQIRTLFSCAPQRVAPHLFVNLINGGKHAAYGSPIQEHQIVPQTDDVVVAYNAACAIQTSLKQILIQAYGSEHVGYGDEGGFIIPSKTIFAPFEHLRKAIVDASVGIPVALSCDVAASSFFENGLYTLYEAKKDTTELLSFYETLHQEFPELVAVEDPFFEKDMSAFSAYTKAYPQILVVGDDLTTTNKAQLQEAIEANAIGGIIIKPNQIGTVSDTLETMALAYEHDIKCIVSHRSGETKDDFIADLAYATGAYGLKAGAPHAQEREAKYQRLIYIQKTR